jgi:hypothetical protein
MRLPSMPRPGHRRIGVAPIPFLLVLVLGGATAGCSADHSGTTTSHATSSTDTPAAHATMMSDPGAGAEGMGAAAGDIPSAEDVAAGWAARPDFVSHATHRTQTAYAFALARPDILRWLPCYCGCGAMGHLSNLDCFVKPADGDSVVFEEHGSYCDVCADIALGAQDMLGRGMTLAQMRAAIDSEFGGLAPGTDTPLPPA